MARHHTRGHYSPGSGQPTCNPLTNLPEPEVIKPHSPLWHMTEEHRKACAICNPTQANSTPDP